MGYGDQSKYRKIFEDAGCKVVKDGDWFLIDDYYKLNISTGWITNLKTDEKTRDPYGLASEIKENRM
ncbi:hypothetical protein [Paenibacillus tianjinensis]|uniref:Uncharacterized protein n=1 Tax=Paenibacillus tianjinensis TaxID=2810347 RepID=A0ABX7L5Q2_9BACL|nr:hypothetical protein [Paenibacillus tianjinensis]QSF43430.1 hypothetical protein JRJ22_19390 [Paenibacillus tianjinensis]